MFSSLPVETFLALLKDLHVVVLHKNRTGTAELIVISMRRDAADTKPLQIRVQALQLEGVELTLAYRHSLVYQRRYRLVPADILIASDCLDADQMALPTPVCELVLPIGMDILRVHQCEEPDVSVTNAEVQTAAPMSFQRMAVPYVVELDLTLVV